MLVKVLKPFKNIIMDAQQDKDITFSHIIPNLHTLIHESFKEVNNEDPALVITKNFIVTKLRENIVQTDLHLIACFVDLK